VTRAVDFYVHPTALVGVPMRPLQGLVESTEAPRHRETVFAGAAHVGAFAVVEQGARIGERVVIDTYCSIGKNADVGDDSLIIYRADVGGAAVVGKECIIGSTISDNAVIGDRCRIFGRIIHKHENPTMSWDHGPAEESVTVHDDTFVGFDAVVAGGIHIGPRAYVTAGAVVTRSVPSGFVASGINQITRYSDWKGLLKDSPLFRGL
jgi:UDP-3-O-[3-hydroxymyristoyl] glucosamine N-acyltransferase